MSWGCSKGAPRTAGIEGGRPSPGDIPEDTIDPYSSGQGTKVTSLQTLVRVLETQACPQVQACRLYACLTLAFPEGWVMGDNSLSLTSQCHFLAVWLRVRRLTSLSLFTHL